MRHVACCLLAIFTGCAAADTDSGFAPTDLAMVKRVDLARPADLAGVVVRDLAMSSPEDLAMASMDLAMTSMDLAMSQAMDLTMPRSDLAMVVDLRMSPADMAMTPPDMAVKPDLAMMPPDMAVKPDLAMAPADMAMGVTCHVIINELETGSGFTGADEFVEFYNPCGNAIDLVNYAMVYRTGTNANGAAAANDDATIGFGAMPNIFVVPAKGYLTACAQGYYLKAECDALYQTATLQNLTGAVGLRDGNGNLVDSVAYGAVALGHAFMKVAPAPPPPLTFAGDSIGRLPNGVDSGNNSKDWKATTTTTIDASNF